MSTNEDVARAAVAHALTESAVAVAVRTIVGRVGLNGHPTQKRVRERVRAFALGAANLALLDDRMIVPDFGAANWRQRLANENAERLSQIFASDAFIGRYVDGLLRDREADVSGSHTGVRDAFAHVFNVVTQVVRIVLIGIDPMMLPQPEVLAPRHARGTNG